MGDIITNPPTVPNTVSDSWQPLVDRDTMSFYGLNRVSLTNWDDTTTAPVIAQGSAIDIDGSIARFQANETIGGSPADGTVWLKFVVSGSIVTGEWTATAPDWYADKAGWYNASGERYSGHRCEKDGASYTSKRKLHDIQIWEDQDRTAVSKTGDSTTDVIGIIPFGICYIEAIVTWQKNNTQSGAPSVYIEAYSAGDWRQIGIGEGTPTTSTSTQTIELKAPTILSDGVNYRVRISQPGNIFLTSCSVYINRFACDQLYGVLHGQL